MLVPNSTCKRVAAPSKLSHGRPNGVLDRDNRPTFPTRFGSLQDARAHCHIFFPWYNTEHHHSGLGLLTPADVHHGLAARRLAARATVLTTAYAAHL